MLSHRFYYELKPFLPWNVRMALRRFSAGITRRKYSATWPIDRSAGSTPEGWPGWPQGKKFAFVLTHDVEGSRGLGNSRQLAELEMELGFRSSFNFIPEGSYAVPHALRHWLGNNGFEIGVHDLHHDGKLFASHRAFIQKAARINHHLQEWGAVGFRSGFMLRKLDWIHGLDIQYDASTFDTDPFELQPEGMGTIFPFWVPAPAAEADDAAMGAQNGRGYVELPYTLPQDSTLFFVLREKTIDVWRRKIDWIAAHGGMVLLNVHPDYLSFAGTGGSREYVADKYAELLRYIANTYAGQFWNPLPKDLACWYKTARRIHRPASPGPIARVNGDRVYSTSKGLRGKRAAVLLYSYYPSDPRPRRAAEAMIEAGMEVDLRCLSETKGESPMETVKGVRVFRHPMRHLRGNKWAYLWQYGRFFLSSFWFLSRNGLQRKYDVVHIHNMPDFLVFAALIPRLRGTRIILDLHDPMPELLMSIYGLKSDRWQVQLLRNVERWSIRFADLVLTPNIAFKKLFTNRSCPPEKVQIVMNSPQQEIFDARKSSVARSRSNGTFRIMHHGLIAHRHGVDLLVEAVGRIRAEIPGVRLDLYGHRTPFCDTILEAARRSNMSDIVHYHGPKPQAEIARAIEECDLGVVPNRRSSFTDINFPTRLFEYLAMHRPVIAPSTEGIRDYFGDQQMLYFKPGDVADLAARILWVWEHPAEISILVRNGLDVYRQHLWSQEKAHFVSLVSALGTRT